MEKEKKYRAALKSHFLNEFDDQSDSDVTPDDNIPYDVDDEYVEDDMDLPGDFKRGGSKYYRELAA